MKNLWKYFELGDCTELKEAISGALIDYQGRRVRSVCGHLLPLLRRGRSYSLNEPNSVGIFTNAELLPTLLKYLISDSEANLTVLDGPPWPSSHLRK
jgi:hypothetical protein